MDDVTRGKIRARHYTGGVALDIGGLAYGCPAGGPPFIVIERPDLDDAIAALQALRGDSPSKCWGCDAVVAGDDALDVTMRCAVCRAASGLPPTEQQRKYAPVVAPPAVIDAAAARHPDLVRKIEEQNERMIAILKECLPPQPGFEAVLDSYCPRDPETGQRTRPGRHRTPLPDFATIKKSTDSSGFVYPVANDPNAPRPDAPTCSRCGARLMFSARQGGDGLCGLCSRDRSAGRLEPIAATPFTAVAAGLAMLGRWRVYFNKHGRADLPWCIAPDGGGWELAVPSVLITTDATTAYQPKATPDDEDGRPSAWIAVEGKLVVASGAGQASITATSEPEVMTP